MGSTDRLRVRLMPQQGLPNVPKDIASEWLLGGRHGKGCRGTGVLKMEGQNVKEVDGETASGHD